MQFNEGEEATATAELVSDAPEAVVIISSSEDDQE